MLGPSDDDQAGSAQTAAINLESSLPISIGLEKLAITPAGTAVATWPARGSISLRATFVLAIIIYLTALAGSTITGTRAPILDAVPLWLGPAVLFWWYARDSFPGAVRARLFMEATIIVITLGVSLACLSYLGALVDLPLRDQEMIWIDRHLGFDWLQMMLTIDHWPGVLRILDAAYATFTSQLLLTIFVLVIAKRAHDLDQFCVTFVCASLLAELASVIVPTLGPISALAGDAEFSNLPTLGRTTADILLALREGTLKEIHFDALDGIISFPSFHATVAVLVPFTLRWNVPLFRVALLLNIVMLLSAVPSGNHYLADVIGGLIVAVLAIAISSPIQRSLALLGPARAASLSAAETQLPYSEMARADMFQSTRRRTRRDEQAD